MSNVSTLFIDYKIWTISTLILNLFAIFFLKLVYKKTSDDFHKFRMGKTIATIVIYLFALFSQVYQFSKIGLDKLDLGSNIVFYSLLFIVLIVNWIVGFFLVYIFISSVVTIFTTIKNKTYKKNKKEFAISWIFFIFGNGYSVAIISGILLIITQSFLHPYLYEPCGIEILNLTTPSSAADAGISINEVIIKIDDQSILTTDDLGKILSLKKPNDVASVTTDKSTYSVTLGSNPQNNSKSFLGANLITKFCDKK